MLKIKLTTTKTDPFKKEISKFAMRQGPRFEIGYVIQYLRGSREEWEGGGRRMGERE